MTLKLEDVLELTPGSVEGINDWFLNRVEKNIDSGLYPDLNTLETIADNI